jgi:Putative transposase/Transposase zinc-binding domain
VQHALLPLHSHLENTPHKARNGDLPITCRNRHCPKCQTNARNQWLTARQQELQPVDYYHLVFSVPHALVPLIWQNKKVLFKLLFDASAATLLEVAADPKHLGAEIGFLGVLHTWGQTLQAHPHIHCGVPGGGLSPDHRKWIRAPNHFFLPVKVLSRVFRGKFVAGLRRAFRQDKLVFFGPCQPLMQERAFSVFLRTLFREDWVVYAKRPFGGPEHVLHYLARYTHRVACDLQPSTGRGDRHSRVVSVEGLCSSQQAPCDDAQARGVSAPVSPTCSTSRLPPHPLLRPTRQSTPRRTAPSLQRAVTSRIQTG